MEKYGNGIGMRMKSLKWEEIGTKNLFLHIPTLLNGYSIGSDSLKFI